MQTFLVYSKNLKDEITIEEKIIIKEGFSFWAAFLGPFWAIYNKSWRVLLLMIGVNILTTAIQYMYSTNINISSLFEFSKFLLIGSFANDFYEWELGLKGYSLEDIIIADNLKHAQLKHYDRLYLSNIVVN